MVTFKSPTRFHL